MCSIAKDIGIDLGTASVLVYVKGKGVVLNEPSVVAIDKNTGKLLKVGAEAQAMLGRTPGNIVAIRPLREGVISDYDMTERMLREFLRKVVGGFQLFKPRVIICVPSGITEVEERAVVDAGIQAGARRVYLIEEPVAAAIGAGIDIAKPDVHHHVAVGLGDVDACADGGGHRLLDEVDLPGASLNACVDDGALLDLRDAGGHADDDPGLEEGEAGDLMDELLQHPLRHVIVGDHALPQRTDGDDIAGGTPQHGLGVGAHLQKLTCGLVHRHHRGLVEDNALALYIYQNGSGTQIDTDIFCQRTHKLHLIIIFVILCGNKPNFIQLSIILTAFAFCKSKLQMFTDLLKERRKELPNSGRTPGKPSVDRRLPLRGRWREAPEGVGALRKHASGMFLASDRGGYAAAASIWCYTAPP